MNHSHHALHDDTPPFWRSAAGLTLLVAVVVGGFYLLTEHRAHLFGALPFVLFLACPLMHVFMHRGHHHGGRRSSSEPRRARDERGQ